MVEFLKNEHTSQEKYYTVSIFGHRSFAYSFDVESCFREQIHSILSQHENVKFIAATDSVFDIMSEMTCDDIKRTLGRNDVHFNWIPPYTIPENEIAEIDSEFFGVLFRELNKYFDFNSKQESNDLTNELINFIYKLAFTMRNRNMIDRSDFVIFNVEHPEGRAYETMQYAIKNGVPFCNLQDMLK